MFAELKAGVLASIEFRFDPQGYSCLHLRKDMVEAVGPVMLSQDLQKVMREIAVLQRRRCRLKVSSHHSC
jgi:hypothetical protein